MPNNTSVISCQISADILAIREHAYLAVYYILAPIYFFIGMTGNIILLFAFKKQSKSEKAYVYQLLGSISGTLEILAFMASVSTRKWSSGLENAGFAWFKRSYVLMFYATHLSVPLANVFLTSTLLFSIAMAADRVIALSKPFKYKNMNHRFYQILTVFICFTLGASSSVFDCFRYRFLWNIDEYKILVSEEFVISNVAIVAAQTRTGIRIVGLCFLVGLDLALVSIFRRRSNKVEQVINSEQKIEARKDAGRTLVLLTISQSVLTVLSKLPNTTYYIMAYVAPSFTGCWGMVMAPFNDGIIAVADAIQFYMVLGINKNCRRLVLGVLPQCGRVESTSVPQRVVSTRAV